MKKTMLVSACAVLVFSACARNEVPPDVTPEQIMTTVSETNRETETEITEEEITEVRASVSAESEPSEGYIDYTDMPEPFHPNAAEGGECILYYSLTDHILAGFPLGLMHAAGYEDFSEFERWVDEMNEKSSGISTSISESTNVFTFIRDHEFDEDKLRELLLSLFEHYNTHLGGSYTAEDAEALISSDEKAVTEKFVNPCAVYHNGKIYTPQWLYEKDIVQYEIEEIPPVLIIEKYDKIMELPFEENAITAFEKKLSDYIGYEVDLTYTG